MKDIDKIIQTYVKDGDPGIAVGMVAHGQVMYRKGYGLAHLESACSVTPTTIFCLASLTKSFTATAILLLEQQKRLYVYDMVSTYLPDFPYPGITIAHLLSHTSGLQDIPWKAFVESWSKKKQARAAGKPLSWQARWQVRSSLLNEMRQETEPGNRFSYTNYGYQLLGLIIEAITNMSYEAFLHLAIFTPLAMETACLVTEVEHNSRIAQSYMQDGGWRIVPFSPRHSLAYSSGGVCASLDDLMRWDRSFHTHQLLEKDTQKRMFTPFQLNDGHCAPYGFGWYVSQKNQRSIVYHGGTLAGYAHFFTRSLDENFSLLLLANNASFRAHRVELTRELSAQIGIL